MDGKDETFLGMMSLRGYLEKQRVTVDFSSTFSTATRPVVVGAAAINLSLSLSEISRTVGCVIGSGLGPA